VPRWNTVAAQSVAQASRAADGTRASCGTAFAFAASATFTTSLPMSEPFLPAPTPSLASSDLRWVAAATMLSWVLSSAFELLEKVSAFSARFETWQVD
jgi:hypothetical protein